MQSNFQNMDEILEFIFDENDQDSEAGVDLGEERSHEELDKDLEFEVEDMNSGKNSTPAGSGGTKETSPLKNNRVGLIVVLNLLQLILKFLLVARLR